MPDSVSRSSSRIRGLADCAVKMALLLPSELPAASRKKMVFFSPAGNKTFIDQASRVKMAGCWLRSFVGVLYMEPDYVSVRDKYL